jgi:uncharacterized protein
MNSEMNAKINTNQPLIGFGQVRHTRVRPAVNAFAYPTYFLMLPMRSLARSGHDVMARNRWAPVSFFDKDHGDGSADALAWLDGLLQTQGITDAQGEAWLHCYPRVLGYTFKPVSFWYCHRADGSLRAMVIEVNNTFGERHVYLLDHARMGQELHASKVFHVSPFCDVQGSYRFRFMTNADRSRTVARIDYDDAQGLLLQTSVSGQLEPLTKQAVRKAMFSYGAMTLGVIARIHWQALKLWFKRVPFFSKPAPPEVLVTR